MTKHLEAPAQADQAQDGQLHRVNDMLARRTEQHAIELDAAHAEMDELARTISHDLRSPLTVIGGFTDLLIAHFSKNLDEKGRHYLDLIKSSTINASQMLDEIFAISRVSRSEIQRSRVDLGEMVGRAVQDLEATKGDRRVIWLVGGGFPSVQADPVLIQRVIKSLLANALIFTRAREVARIQVGVRHGNHEVILFVRDNGSGVDLKHRERMFASFQHRKSSAVEGGAVGLAHVQRIIQRHGGRMWTEAVPDGGAIFYFSLPNDAMEPEFRSERA
jgi:signal transduction histidine kinase